jgi:hypothetical protein
MGANLNLLQEMEDGQMGNELHLHESKIHSGGAKTNQ